MSKPLSGPDFNLGVPAQDIIEDTPLLGHADGEAVIVVRHGDVVSALGATCSHYGGPLAKGLVSGTTIRCPWHHACFDIMSGEATRAPALDPIDRWKIGTRDGKIHTAGKIERAKPSGQPNDDRNFVIIGGGGAGEAASEMLRREGFAGRIMILSADADAPPDRPDLSKNFLSGDADAADIPLRAADFYKQQNIDLRLGTKVTRIDPESRQVTLQDGGMIAFDSLLLATGAAPRHLTVPGGDAIYYLRSFADSRALVAAATSGSSAVVIGSSFIGMEVAAALRKREVKVDVVTQETVPMQTVLGPELGAFIRALHEDNGVTFHTDTAIASIDNKTVTLKNGKIIAADLIVAGIGVEPLTDLAEQAGIDVKNGILVNEYLETSSPGIFAAGDIARWPDPQSGTAIRVEHWVVAQTQGQVAARNMLGKAQPYDYVPFFWTSHFGVPIRYVGHASKWDEIRIDGSLADRDCAVHYIKDGKTIAMATIKRDMAAMKFAVEQESR